MSHEARQFWTEARNRVQVEDCDFSGQHFPDDPDKQGFQRITFRGLANFNKATFEGDADFTQATFEGDADFRQATSQRNAWFDEATFQGNAWFDKATFQGIAWFSDTTFQGTARFVGVAFNGETRFERGEFQETAQFMAATFGENVYFDETEFGGDASFLQATFRAGACFYGAVARSVTIDPPNSIWCSLWHGPRPFRIPKEGEVAYRLAKQCAQDHGDYRRAGDYHYAEQCAINWQNRKSATWGPWTYAFLTSRGWPLGPWLEWFFARGIFGYGEKPARPLVSAALVILVCAGLYSWGGLVEGIEKEDVLVVTDIRQKQVSVVSDVTTENVSVVTGIAEQIGSDDPDKPEQGETPNHIAGKSEIPVVTAVAKDKVSVVTELVQEQLPVATTTSEGAKSVITHDPRSVLYFSIVTFTTLGYGDLLPGSGWMRTVACFEALCGVALMALFIVALARKFTR